MGSNQKLNGNLNMANPYLDGNGNAIQMNGTAAQNAANTQQSYTNANSDPAVMAAIQSLNQPGANVNQILSNIMNNSGTAGSAGAAGAAGNMNMGDANLVALLENPLSGQAISQSQVMNNPLLAGYFGQGGMQQQAQNNYSNYGNSVAGDESQIAGTNANIAQAMSAMQGSSPLYGMTSTDLAAYGQAAGNIDRNYANYNQQIAQNLAQRGLGSASNGITAANYAGSMGNQMEQLASLQTQIAQNRIATAQGLTQSSVQDYLSQLTGNNQTLSTDQTGQANSGNLANSLGTLGLNALNSQQAYNTQGANNILGSVANQNTAQQAQLAQAQNIENAGYGLALQNYQPNLGQQIVSGLAGGVTGAVGQGLGTALGSALSPAKAATQATSPAGGAGMSGQLMAP